MSNVPQTVFELTCLRKHTRAHNALPCSRNARCPHWLVLTRRRSSKEGFKGSTRPCIARPIFVFQICLRTVSPKMPIERTQGIHQRGIHVMKGPFRKPLFGVSPMGLIGAGSFLIELYGNLAVSQGLTTALNGACFQKSHGAVDWRTRKSEDRSNRISLSEMEIGRVFC